MTDDALTKETMTDEAFDLDLSELASAEDFLDYFGIPFDSAVVQVNRLHILQRFHDYLEQTAEMPTAAAERWRLHADLLQAAYRDFLTSTAADEKVFRVFRMHEPRSAAVPLSALTQQAKHAPPV